MRLEDNPNFVKSRTPVETLEGEKSELVSLDRQAVTQDLIDRGYSREDLLAVAGQLEQASLSDKRTDGSNPVNFSKGVQDVIDNMPYKDELAVPFGGQPLSFDDTQPLPLDIEPVRISNIPTEPEAVTELATLVGDFIGEDSAKIEETFAAGDESAYTSALAALGEDLHQQGMQILESKINEAQTAAEVQEALMLAKAKEAGGWIPLVEFRKAYLGKRVGDPTAPIADMVQTNFYLAAEIEKRQAEAWKNASLLSLGGDFGEIVLPVIGASQEELIKYNRDLDGIIDKINSSGSLEEKQKVLLALLDDLETTQTAVIGNTNYLINSDQIEYLRSVILGGALQEELSALDPANVESAIWSVFNGTVVLGEIAAIGRGFKGLATWLKYRTQPQPTGEIYDLATKVRGVALDPIMTETVDIRDGLRATAANKNTRKFRKDLEAEKKTLGSLEAKLTAPDAVKKRSEEIRAANPKVKFKESMAQAKRAIEEELTPVRNRMSAVQSMIDDFDRAASAESQLSRIDTFLRDGRLSEESLVSTRNVSVDANVQVLPKTAKEMEYTLSPETFQKDLADGVVVDNLVKGGAKVDDVVAQLLPIPTPDTARGLPDAFQTRDDISVLILSDESPKNVAAKLAARLEEQALTRIRLNPSMTGFEADDIMEDSYGVFTFMFGNSNGKGFKTAAAAEQTAKNNIFGNPYEVVAQDGQFWIRVKERHKFDPIVDTAGVPKADASKGTPLMDSTLGRLFLNPLRTLAKDVMDGVFSLRLANKKLSNDLSKRMQDAISTVNPTVGRKLLKALSHGDEAMWEAADYTDFLKTLNLTDDVSSQKAYERYQDVRSVMDEIFKIRNENFRNGIIRRGMKQVKVGDGEFLYGKRVRNSEVGSKVVYDVSTNKVVNQSELGLDDIVFEVGSPVKAADGSLYTYVRVKPDFVSEVPPVALNRIPGYIDRMYRDTGYVVRTTTPVIKNGVESTQTSVTHIFKTRKEANQAAEQVRAETGNQAEVFFSRENDDLDIAFADDTSVQYGYGASHTRARTEGLRGPEGKLAPTVDLFDRLMHSVRSTERMLERDVVASLKARIMSEYKDLLRGKPEWKSNFEEMFKKASEIPAAQEKSLTRAKAFHNYIRAIESAEHGRIFAAIDSSIRYLTRDLIQSDFTATNVAVIKVVTAAQIVSNVFYQMLQGAVQAFVLPARYGARAPLAIIQSSLLLANKLVAKNNPKFAANLLMTDEKTAKEFLEFIDKSGLMDIGNINDFLAFAPKGSRAAPTTKLGVAGRVAGSAIKAPLAAAQAGQEQVLKAINFITLVAEFSKQMAKKGAKFDAKTKSLISFNTQRANQTQTSLDQFWYQQKTNPAALPLMYAQHMHKQMLDLILDPIIKVGTGGRKNLGTDAGPYSETFAGALWTLTYMTTMFGFTGIAGEKGGGSISDAILENYGDKIPQEMKDFIADGGYINTMMNFALKAAYEKFFGEKAEGFGQFSTRMGPSGFIDYVNDRFLQNIGSVDMLGPAGGFLGQLATLLYNGYNLWDLETMDTDEKAEMFVREVGSLLTGVKNSQKAYVAYNLKFHPYFTNMSSDLKATRYEAMLQMLSVSSKDVADFERVRGAPPKVSTSEERMLINVFARAVNTELAGLAEGGQLDMFKVSEVIAKWGRHVNTAFHGRLKSTDLHSTWLNTVLTSKSQTYQSYIKPYLDSSLMIKDIVPELRSREAQAQNPELKQLFKALADNAEQITPQGE